MSLTDELLGATERYHDMGITIVPVGCKDEETPGRPGKEVLMEWKGTIDHGKVMDIIAGDTRCSGIAAVAKDDLIFRDFDRPESLEAWIEQHAALAGVLPISESARGGQVCARSHGVKTTVLGDGELRAHRSIVVLPPSRTVDPGPGRPRQYRILRPFPKNLSDIPEIDPACLLPSGFPVSRVRTRRRRRGAVSTADTAGHPLSPAQAQSLNTLCKLPIDGIDIAECIFRTLPTGPGQRHRCLWELARWLRAILPADTSDAEIRAIAAEWFGHAKHVIRTKSLRVTQNRLVEAWHDVEVPAGGALSLIVATAEADEWRPRLGGAADRIARLIRAGCQAHGWGDFEIDYRNIARVLGITPPAAHKSAALVEQAGYALILDRGKASRVVRDSMGKVWVERGKRTIWRWTGPSP